MFHRRQSSNDYLEKKLKQHQNKIKQQSSRRHRRKRSLLSSLSRSLIKSPSVDEPLDDSSHSTHECLTLDSENELSSLHPSMTPNRSDDIFNQIEDFDLEVESNNEIVSDTSSYSSTSEFVDDLNDATSEEIFMDDDLDHRPLFTNSTVDVQQFSIDILEFARSSRMPENQRSRLLQLFKKYLPAPNSVPSSTNSLLSKFFTCDQ